MWNVTSGRRRAGFGLLVAVALALALPHPLRAADDTAESARCSLDDDDPSALSLNAHGLCLVLSGSASVTYSRILQSSAGVSGLPLQSRRNGGSIDGTQSTSLYGSARLDAGMDTDVGRFAFAFEAGWTKIASDASAGAIQISELSVALGGAHAGYASSMTAFWDADILASGYTPQRTVGQAYFEQAINDTSKVAFGFETGPATNNDLDNFLPISGDWAIPFAVLRYTYTGDSASVLVAGFTRAGVSEDGQNGWGATIGASATVTPFGRDDTVSMQATYTRGAVSYAGSALEFGSVRQFLTNRNSFPAWSATASYARSWTDEWTSTIYFSHLQAQDNAGVQTFRSDRAGVNLIWLKDGLKIGAELAWADIWLSPDLRDDRLGAGRLALAGEAIIAYVLVEKSF